MLDDMLPVFPPRLTHTPGPLHWLLKGRENSLAVWHQAAFFEPLLHRRLPGRTLFVVNSSHWIRQVLVSRAKRYAKSEETRRMIRPLIGDSLFIAEGEAWRRQRQLIVPPLARRGHLPAFASVMIAAIGETLERWLALGEDVEMEFTREATRLAADVLGRALFSFPLAGHADLIYGAFQDYQDSLGRLDVAGLLGLPAWLPYPGRGRGLAAAARLNTVVEEVIAAHASRPDGPQDLLDSILRAHAPGAEFEAVSQARDQLMMLLLAGHETTANALSWTFYLLALFPAARMRLEQEVDHVLGKRPPLLEDLAHLPYTRAVLNESLRLYPPIPLFSREPLDQDHFGAHVVPAHSLVLIAPWLVHRHRRYWRDPDAFLPERFLNPESGPCARYGFIPFGAGGRVCPGATFATTELMLILAMVAQRLRLHLRPGHPVEPLGRLTLRPRHGLPMRLERR